ncbi:MAG TPA: zinc ribbon domain-containing protein, partial [Pirellulales bacterium]
MIVFGTRGVTSSAASGNFYCPSCRGQSSYTHKRVRRFFTLYFIPVIPLGTIGEYVECGGCKGTFKPEVLHLDPAAAQTDFVAEFHRAMLRVMTSMTMINGPIGDQEMDRIRTIFQKLTGQAPAPDEVQLAMKDSTAAPHSIVAALAPIAQNVNDHGKELIVKAACLVASSGGGFQA